MNNERKYLILAIFFYFAISLSFIISTPLVLDYNVYSHYLISRQSFDNPKLFLDIYGKPLFTLLSSPFAQISLFSYRLFSVILGAGTLILVYLLSKEYNLKRPVLPVLFTTFSSYFIYICTDGFTESLGALLLILVVFLFKKEKYFFGATIASLLIMVRSEAIFIMAFFGLVLLLKRKFLAIPLLGAGGILYSITTKLIYNDFFWYFQGSPNVGSVEASGIYPAGPFFYYIVNLIIGLGPLVFFSIQPALKEFKKYYLLILPSLIYLLLHSFILAYGLFGATAQIRQIAIFFPLLGILAGIGFSKFKIKHSIILGIELLVLWIFGRGLINSPYPFWVLFVGAISLVLIPLSIKFKKLTIILILGLLSILVTNPYIGEKYPGNICNIKVYDAACVAIQQLGLEERELFSHPPYIYYCLDKPLYGHMIHANLLDDDLPIGSLIVYDLIVGPMEGQMPIKELENNPRVTLLTSLRAKGDLKEHCEFEVRVYEVTGPQN